MHAPRLREVYRNDGDLYRSAKATDHRGQLGNRKNRIGEQLASTTHRLEAIEQIRLEKCGVTQGAREQIGWCCQT